MGFSGFRIFLSLFAVPICVFHIKGTQVASTWILSTQIQGSLCMCTDVMDVRIIYGFCVKVEEPRL